MFTPISWACECVHPSDMVWSSRLASSCRPRSQCRGVDTGWRALPASAGPVSLSGGVLVVRRCGIRIVWMRADAERGSVLDENVAELGMLGFWDGFLLLIGSMPWYGWLLLGAGLLLGVMPPRRGTRR